MGQAPVLELIAATCAGMVMVNVMVENREGEAERLLRVKFPALPRKGDRLRLFGPQFGDETTGRVPGDRAGEVVLEVKDVIFAAVSETGVEFEAEEVEVLVRVPAELSPPQLTVWCLCKPEERINSARPGFCDYCGDRLPEEDPRGSSPGIERVGT